MTMLCRGRMEKKRGDTGDHFLRAGLAIGAFLLIGPVEGFSCRFLLCCGLAGFVCRHAAERLEVRLPVSAGPSAEEVLA